ncbi:MAG: XdhC family protein, partial [Pseudomonadota bacterium]
MSPPTARHAPDQIPEQALAWVEAGRGAALATVTRTWGSAPRPVGAQLAVSSDAELAGSVSGGCVEGAVTAEALEAIEDGRPRMLNFGVSDDDAFAVGLPCGGEIEILVEPIGVGDGPSAAFLRELVDHRRSREAVIAAVNVETWERQLTTLAALPRSPAPETREAEAVDALVGGRSGYSTAEPGWFHATHPAPLRMVIVGAVHIAQALVPMARLAGFDVTVIDPRGAFATPARFPELDPARISQEYPGAVLAEHGLDLSTAVV